MERDHGGQGAHPRRPAADRAHDVGRGAVQRRDDLRVLAGRQAPGRVQGEGHRGRQDGGVQLGSRGARHRELGTLASRCGQIRSRGPHLPLRRRHAGAPLGLQLRRHPSHRRRDQQAGVEGGCVGLRDRERGADAGRAADPGVRRSGAGARGRAVRGLLQPPGEAEAAAARRGGPRLPRRPGLGRPLERAAPAGVRRAGLAHFRRPARTCATPACERGRALGRRSRARRRGAGRPLRRRRAGA
mmetsp:Transcript_26616/g.80193  ORF Transcript_26616/g.80193 Transcript_26616/m.80193 type:complete len:243 (+) Transcript_26616:797-1525(+)